MSPDSRILVRVLALVAAVWLLSGLPQPEDTLLWDAIYNAGHAPLFGFMALCILSLLKLVLPGWDRRKLYLVAFATTAVLGAATELVQFFAPRDADAGDFLRNIAGAASFLAGRSALETGPAGRPWIRGTALRMTVLGSALIVLLAVFLPVAGILIDYRARDDGFPVLCGFESEWEESFVQPMASGLERSELPARFGEPDRRRVGRWTLYSRPWPGILIREPVPDWTGYRAIAFEIWSGLDRPVTLALRVEDRMHHPGSDDRARVRFQVDPGRNEFRFGLEEIRTAPAARPLALDSIAMVMLYARQPEEPFTLWVDAIRLE